MTLQNDWTGRARLAARTLTAAALLAGVAAPSAAVVPVTGDVVLYWNQLFLGTTPYSPAQARPAALLNIAVHDAANATLGNADYSYLQHVTNAGGDTRAAVSVAAHDVLVSQYAGRAAEFDAALVASLALIPDGTAKTNGMATGAKFAAAALANRAHDGYFDVVPPYVPSGLPGRYAPTPPGFGPPVNPQLATADTWLMTSNDQFRAPPPPELTSAQYTAAFNEVRDIGSATSGTRSAEQTAAAQYWAVTQGTGPWLQAAIDISQASGASTLANARTLAKLSVGVADAILVAWDSKFHYDYWRPVTAIRAADTDGNPDTDAVAGWTPLLVTPPHQSYVSAHSTISGAAARILEAALGDTHDFCVTSLGVNRCWTSFSDAEMESVNSRLWGGIHWRFDNEAGLAAGEALGAYTFDNRVFGAVPEPAAWGLMLAGFTLVGTALRRRVRRVAA